VRFIPRDENADGTTEARRGALKLYGSLWRGGDDEQLGFLSGLTQMDQLFGQPIRANFSGRIRPVQNVFMPVETR
jgi:hypothetical protein